MVASRSSRKCIMGFFTNFINLFIQKISVEYHSVVAAMYKESSNKIDLVLTLKILMTFRENTVILKPLRVPGRV